MTTNTTADESAGQKGLKKHRLTWQLLLETNRDISSILDLHELLTLISQRATTLLEADDCVIFRLDEDGISLCPIMGHGEFTELSMDCPLQVGQGITGHSVAIGKPLIVNNAQHDPRGVHVLGTPVDEEEHLLVTPLNFRGKIIGAMLINRVCKSPFTQEDFSIFTGFASQVAIALENARLYENMERHTQALEAEVKTRTAQIEQQSRWLETILHTVQDALIVTDCSGLIRMVNPAALKITEQSVEGLIGKSVQPILDRLTGGNGPRSDDLLASSRGQLELGAEHYQYSIATFDDVQTGRSGYVFLLTDITPLQRLNNLKSQMIRIASHDLRSPINAIGLQSYLLRRNLEKTSDEALEHLDRMERSLAELKAMVSDLLDVERIEQQASGFSDTIEAQLLVTSVVSLLESQFQQKDQHVTVSIADDIPTICGDPVRLLEAIRNLLTNAHKYTPPQGRISISLTSPNNLLRFTVADTGMGISSDDIHQIFEPNFRTRGAIQSGIEGSGVGLSLVRAIIEEHSGKVFVDSQPGEGSTFGFELPIDRTCVVEITRTSGE